MIVPKHWAESKVKKIVNGKQFTLKRFGWSDTSEEDAKIHADTRISEAVRTLETEGDVRRIDHKTSYNGAEGVPIREEVISTHEDVVISRNSYGALCLNTPDVLFADIDFELKSSFKINLMIFVLLIGCAIAISFFFKSSLVFLGSTVIAVISSITLGNIIRKAMHNTKDKDEKEVVEKIKCVSKENPELNIRLYRTSKGCRVLLMNKTYAPTSSEASNILESFKSDRFYNQMCKNQNCFRARVSPKPWRIDIDKNPINGVWPINPKRLAEREKWLYTYEKKAKNYSSCHFLLQLGSHEINDKAEYVRRLHDDMCKVNDNKLELA